MNARKLYVLVICAFCLGMQFTHVSTSFLDWIWPNRNVQPFRSSFRDLPNIQFELGDNDDKFIAESSKLLGRQLSKADFCQQRVVLSLATNCNNLSEEQLRKLSVDFYNCQLQAESRQTHACSENMPIEECTESLNPEERSSYNQIYGQAKQLCLSIRQDQFRGLTELTVNKLIQSSHNHLELMDELHSSQKLLEKSTLSSLEKIIDNHLKLLDQQEEILRVTEFQKHNAEAGLREIVKEKTLLKIGNNELNSFILTLKEKINQGKQDYSSLLTDFENLHLVASRITLLLEEITEEISERGEENYALLETTKRQIYQVTEIVDEAYNFVMELKKEFNGFFTWIEFLFGNENTMERLVITLIHGAALLIGMLSLVFVGADFLSRYLFLGVIAANLMFTLSKIYELNVGTLMKTIGVLLIGNVAVKIYTKYNLNEFFKKYMSKLNKKSVDHPIGTIHNMSEIFNKTYSRENLNISNEQNTVDRHKYHILSHNHDQNVSWPTRRVSVNREASTSSVSSRRSVNRHNQCSATTLKGTQCSLSAYDTTGFCNLHNKGSRDRDR